MLKILLAVSFSYLLGAIPFALIIAKLTKGIDIRKIGSGNVGATNVYRAVSKPAGIIVLILDIAKGFLATVFIASAFYQINYDNSLPGISLELLKILAGVASICGHNWSIFLGFKGGKGVATSTGVLLGLAPKAVGLTFLLWVLVVLISHYVSLASIFASVGFPIFAIILRYPGNSNL